MHVWKAGPGQSEAEAIRSAAHAIRDGAVIAVPTETYYGLAADLRDADALDRVRRLKGREEDKPLLLLVRGLDDVESLSPTRDDRVRALAEAFWPGPLTLVVTARPGLPKPVVSEGGGVAVRHSPHPMLGALLQAVGGPVSGTSANRAGAPPAVIADAVDLPGLYGVLDGGPTPGGAPSTLLDLRRADARILRQGPVTAARLSEILGERLL